MGCHPRMMNRILSNFEEWKRAKGLDEAASRVAGFLSFLEINELCRLMAEREDRNAERTV